MAAADLLAWWYWWLSSPDAAAAAWWFLVLNVLVGAIAVTSSRAQQQRASRRRLCRSASSMVLDRLRRSFSVHSAAGAGEWCSSWYYGSQEAADKITQVVREEWWVPEPEPAAAESEPVGTVAAPAPAPANVLAAATAAVEEKAVADDVRHEFCRQSDAQGSPSSPPPAAAVATTDDDEATSSAVPLRPAQRRQEEAEPAPASVAEFAKPNRRSRGHAYAAEVEGKAELNARAERFIRQFRQDLRLQRLNSILSATHPHAHHHQ